MNHYSIHVELNERDVTEKRAEELLDALSDYSAGVGQSPFGWLDVQLTLPADSLAQATRTALTVVAEAARAEVIRVEVMTEEQFDLRQGHAPTPQLIGAADAAELLQVSKQRIVQMVAEGKLAGQKVGNSLVLDRALVEARRPAPPK